MVDFKKLRESGAKAASDNPREIFLRLPKPPDINDLYTSQSEVLDAWYARRNENDLVIKLNTGGGKTLIGLLIAQSHMNEKKTPCVYLCPTNQLVDQTIQKAQEYGIPAARYEKGEPFPVAFENGEAVLVGAYQTLFNGKSRFGVRGGRLPLKVGMIILDDAHVALSAIRETFTFEITKEKNNDAYRFVTNCFRAAFKELNKDAQFDDITSGKDAGVLEAPYWAWHTKAQEVREYLSKIAENVGLYSWPLLRDNFHLCHLLISRQKVSITPIFPLVDMFPSFDECSRRIYMSATIADDSDIIRTFDASIDQVSKPISSTSLAGVSERMILVPELMDIGNSPTIPLIKKIIREVITPNEAGALVLVSSGQAAAGWTDICLHPETSEAVPAAIQGLKRKGIKKPLVLANRYDGIDLKDGACRLLVVDGLPKGTSDYDHFRAERFASETINNFLAQRIEQGVGRGARGPHDYCVVILHGKDLVSWIGKNENLQFLTNSTRKQLDIGRSVSEEVRGAKDLIKTIEMCLSRDSEWKKFHAESLAEAAKLPPVPLEKLQYAATERKAFRLAAQASYKKGEDTLIKYVESNKGQSKSSHAWFYELAGRISSAGGNENHADELQEQAFALNRNLLRPRRKPKYVPLVSAGQQATKVCQILAEYHVKASAIAEFDNVASLLNPNSTSNQFEQALCDIARFIGIDAERPEKDYGVGPDVIWIIPNTNPWVIEAKSRKKDTNPLDKEEHGQLLNAQHWFETNYPGKKCVRVSIHPSQEACEDATPTGTRVFTFQHLNTFLTNIKGLLKDTINSDLDGAELEKFCHRRLHDLSLLEGQIENRYLQQFKLVKCK